MLNIIQLQSGSVLDSRFKWYDLSFMNSFPQHHNKREVGGARTMILFIKTSHLFLSDSFLQATTGFISSLIISLFLLQRAGYHSYCSDFYVSLLLFRIYRFLAIFRLFIKCFKQMIRKRNHFFLLINFCSKTMKKY